MSINSNLHNPYNELFCCRLHRKSRSPNEQRTNYLKFEVLKANSDVCLFNKKI